MVKPILFSLLAVALAGCKPELNQTVSIITGPELLAARSDPAEVPPKGQVQLTALVVDPSGPLQVPVDWAFCNARKPLAELGPVSQQCLQSSGSWFVPVGDGMSVQGAVPDIACKQFGPEVPQAMGNQPAGRPVDPDSTGGYYQPLRVLVPTTSGTELVIAETRLACDIAGTPDQLVTFKSHSTANVNPALDSLTAGGVVLSPDPTTGPATTNPVHPGESLDLVASWAACPQATGVCGDHFCDLAETAQSCPGDCMTVSGCTGAETYINLDLNSRNLVTQREGMEVAWFATGGAFDNDRSGRAPTDTVSSSPNRWRAPTQAGVVQMWIVLRDDRGGTGWAQYSFDVH